jgi:hypothetical protein
MTKTAYIMPTVLENSSLRRLKGAMAGGKCSGSPEAIGVIPVLSETFTVHTKIPGFPSITAAKLVFVLLSSYQR